MSNRPHAALIADYTARLAARPGVISVEMGKDAAGSPVIRVLVDPATYDPGLIPQSLGNMPVEVRFSSPAQPLHAPHTAQVRPVRPGVSCGSGVFGAGTLGGFVTHRGRAFIVSNNHVLALNDPASIGAEVIQPAWIDNGSFVDTIGIVRHFDPFELGIINRRDMAIAEVLSPGTIDMRPLDFNAAPSGIYRVPQVGETVFKSGRSTGFTSGVVEGTDAVINVGPFRGIGDITFAGTIRVSGPGFTAPGDSGSWVYDRQMGMVGMLFAGNNQGDAWLINPLEVELYLNEQVMPLTTLIHRRLFANVFTVLSPPPPPPPPPRTLVAIWIAPVSLTLEVGQSAPLGAAGLYSDGSTPDITNLVQWISVNPTVASVDSSGVVRGVSTGQTDITATLGGIGANSSRVTVQAPPPPPVTITRIRVVPSAVTLRVGQTRRFVATGFFSNGTQRGLTRADGLGWGASNPAVASIDNNGLVTARAAGTSVMAATVTGASASGTGTVTVPAPPPPVHEFASVVYYVRLNGLERRAVDSSNWPPDIGTNVQWRVQGLYRGAGMQVVLEANIGALNQFTGGSPVSLPASPTFVSFEALTFAAGLSWAGNIFNGGDFVFSAAQLLKAVGLGGIDGVAAAAHLVNFTRVTPVPPRFNVGAFIMTVAGRGGEVLDRRSTGTTFEYLTRVRSVDSWFADNPATGLQVAAAPRFSVGQRVEWLPAAPICRFGTLTRRYIQDFIWQYDMASNNCGNINEMFESELVIA